VCLGGAVVGVALVAAFCAVLFAYACTEYFISGFDVRRRVREGESGLRLILAVNFISFALLLIGGSVLVAASGHDFYLQAAVIAAGAQMLWLTLHLRFYYHNRLRVSFEN
jgi:hypothetical protein